MITIYTVLVLVSIALQAFFTASEIALTSVSRIRLKNLVNSGNKHAIRLSRFLETEGDFFGATLVGTNIAVVVSSILATRIFAEYFGPQRAPVMTTIVLVPLALIFAEIVPKLIARQYSSSLALLVVTPLQGFSKIFYPVIVMVNAIGRFIIAPFGREKSREGLSLTKGDIKRIVLSGYKTGSVESDEVELIHKVLDFGIKKVEDIMVPLYRVSSINEKDTLDILKKLVSITGFSRIPVYAGNKNNIIGIANIYDILFETDEGGEKMSVRDYLRDVVSVSQKDGLDIALARLRHKKQPMCMVVDKKNNVVGIVTIEDMLEEIVGEIEDTR